MAARAPPTRNATSTSCAETASLLTYAADDEIPEDLWTRIEMQLSAAPPPLRLVAVKSGEHRADREHAAAPLSRPHRPWVWGIAAADPGW